MTPYLDLLRLVLTTGRPTPTRAVLASTGSPVSALSLFGVQARYDLAEGFPLCTTKRVSFRSVVAELLWFLSGSTNVRELQDQGVRIWDQWAGDDGELGPIYSKQWRDFGGVDQVAGLIRGIRAVAANPTHPLGRRLILTAWNPPELDDMALPPCHVMTRFAVHDGRLSAHLFQRSGDLFLGIPYNVASYALLTHMLARSAGLGVGEFVHSISDAHIYANHVDQVREQLTREPLPLPRIVFAKGSPMDPLEIRADHVRLKGYRHLTGLCGEVAI